MSQEKNIGSSLVKTMVGKKQIVGLLIGVSVVLAVLFLGNWAYKSYSVKGAEAQLVNAYTTTLTNLPAMPGNCSAVMAEPLDPNSEERQELFPGSYATYALYNTGCYGDLRDLRCQK